MVLDLHWLFTLLEPTALPLGAVDEAHVQRLIERAKRGDREAVTALYRLHAPRVHRTVRALTRSDAEAEDVVQETFVRAIDAIARYERRSEARFLTWLLTIATNIVRKRWRRAARLELVEPVALEREIDGGTGAEETLSRLQQKRALLAALAELDERDRTLLSLRYGGELDATEIAGLVAMSPANVRKTCERLRAKLLARLSEENVEEAHP